MDFTSYFRNFDLTMTVMSDALLLTLNAGLGLLKGLEFFIVVRGHLNLFCISFTGRTLGLNELNVSCSF